MPQMKPMLWLIMMILTTIMIMLTIMVNFFSTMELINQNKSKKIKTLKWKW